MYIIYEGEAERRHNKGGITRVENDKISESTGFRGERGARPLLESSRATSIKIFGIVKITHVKS